MKHKLAPTSEFEFKVVLVVQDSNCSSPCLNVFCISDNKQQLIKTRWVVFNYNKFAHAWPISF